MKISELIRILQGYNPDFNARAYEGEDCGIVIETDSSEHVTVIPAHESDEYTKECWGRQDLLRKYERSRKKPFGVPDDGQF